MAKSHLQEIILVDMMLVVGNLVATPCCVHSGDSIGA